MSNAMPIRNLALPDTKEVDSKALAAVKQAHSIVVQDAAGYEAASTFLIGLKELQKTIAETFDPVIKAAHEAHKAALAAKAKHSKPVEEAERIVKAKLVDYQEREAARQREEEARLREAALREEQEQLARQVEFLIETGRPEEALALMDAPIEAPPVIVPEATPQVKGIVTREVWKFRIKDERLIPREYMIPDMAKIGKVVRATEGKISIPGVEVYKEKEIAVGSGR